MSRVYRDVAYCLYASYIVLHTDLSGPHILHTIALVVYAIGYIVFLFYQLFLNDKYILNLYISVLSLLMHIYI